MITLGNTTTPNPAAAFPALFALHGSAPAPVEQPEDPGRQAVLAFAPLGPARTALADLLDLTSAHPVRVWGREQEASFVLAIDASEDWQAANPELWQRVLRAWRAALGVLAGPGRSALPLGSAPAGPSRG